MLTLLLSPLSAFAGGEGDNSIVSKIQYKDYNYIHNIEDGSMNPVSISDMAVPELLQLRAGFFGQGGAYHPVDGSTHTDGGIVDVYGITLLKKVAFEGGLNYKNVVESSKFWNSTLYQSPLNPFILADSEPSKYSSELFHVFGKVSYKINNRFRVGINADYHVGVMSDETDPRLETKGMRFILNPGVQWNATKNLQVGATGGINLFNESIRYTCLGVAVNYPFYAMSGLGTYYPQSGSSYSRDSKGVSWFAGADVKYVFTDRIADYLTFSFNRYNENSTDGGSSYQFKAGEYMNDVWRIANRFSYNTGRYAHNVEIAFENNSVKGRWYDQKSITVNGTTHYEVMGSSIKHKQSLAVGSVAYRFDRLNREGVTTFTAGAKASLTSSDAKNYPEVYFRKYSHADLNANATKYFNIKKVRMGVGANAGCGLALSGSYDFAGIELADSYSIPLYSYLTSSSFSAGGRISADLPLKIFILGIYVEGSGDFCMGGKTDLFKNKRYGTISSGLSVTF